MRIEELSYELPPECIAQQPAERRDASRLLVIDRATGQRRHETFAALPGLLPPGALLVMNDTRVLPARLRLRRPTGGRIEGLFLHEPEPGMWELMLAESRRLRLGELLTIESSQQQIKLVARRDAGIWHGQPVPVGDAHAVLMQYGEPPLPPYIKRGGRADGEGEKGRGGEGERQDLGFRIQGSGNGSVAADVERYQTIYARQPGAIAAPTAGLHFSPEVFAALEAAGISRTFVTLHVGVGTFAPIRCGDLADHQMHSEWYECSEATAVAVNAARREGRKIVAIGTTSVRVLETCAAEDGTIRPGSGWTRLFIYPPYRFKAVDAMVTNFHLPGSTLLAMVFAFAGRDSILGAYEEAIAQGYRFYSYGDATLVV